jgi:ATP-binding cassette subfamily B protein
MVDHKRFNQVEFRTSIDLDGNPSCERLVANEVEVSVWTESLRRRRTIRFDRVDQFRIETAVGSCFLQVLIKGKWRDLLRWPGKADESFLDLLSKLSARIPGSRLTKENLDQPPADDQPTKENVSRDASKSNRQFSLRPVARLLKIFRPFRRSMALLLALSLGAVVIDLVPPMLQRLLVDRVLQIKMPENPQSQLLLYLSAIIGGLLIVRLAAATVAIWKGVVSNRVGTTLTANIRNELVGKLNALPMAFHDRNQVGVLMSQVAYDTESLHMLVYHMTSGLLLQLFQLFGIGVMLFYLNAKLAVIALLPVPLIVLGSWYFSNRLSPRHRHYWEAVGKQASALMGMLTGIRVVKAFAQEDREMERFRASSNRLRDARLDVERSTTVFTALMGLLFGIGTLAVWYIGGHDVMAGVMTLGSLMAFLAYLAVFYTPLTTIAESTAWFTGFLNLSSRMNDLLETPSENETGANAGDPTRCRGGIRFENVTFGYDKSRPVLKHIDFSVEPGEFIGVVGRSGSGKSTLISLIARLYEADSGRVLHDGVDVRTLNPRDLRRKIGMVPQEPFLFRGSIAENIAYGNPGASPKQILEAAKRADAHAFIMRLPFSYETQLGEGGTGLSGGERQRLSIARALLCDPAILILDEATASVDAKSEWAISQSLSRDAIKRTVFIIAHRFSMLKSADRLLVFDQGQLVEQGTFEELVNRNGVFASLARLQGNSCNNSSRTKHRRNSKAVALSRNGYSQNQYVEDRVALDPSTQYYPKINGHNTNSLNGANSLNGFPSKDSSSNKHRTLGLRWLRPDEIVLENDRRGNLRVTAQGRHLQNIFALQAFPTLHGSKFISLMCRRKVGDEVELGVIESLEDWSETAQKAVKRSLARRFTFRVINDLREVRRKGNVLALRVSTSAGEFEFQLKNPGECGQPFGKNGLLLGDEDGMYYVIPDCQKLPAAQLRLLSLYLGER